jgi:methenyltetrahydromethanopterin cyclohydrolase
LEESAERLRIARHHVGPSQVWDFGVRHTGSLEAGRQLAAISLAGGATVEIHPGDADLGLGLQVVVWTDDPLTACLGCQYAGWRIHHQGYFAMGSGPMRMAAIGHEPLLKELGLHETTPVVAGVLESAELPGTQVCEYVASTCAVPPENLTLCVAPTRSLCGTFQIVARSVETAMHKIHQLGFDPRRVHTAWGAAPLPPPAADDLTAIGRTNDAILYGARTVLWVDATDQELEALAPQVPSCASADYGSPFAELFQRYGGDFYRIDPMLFSPAQVTLVSLRNGRIWRAGKVDPALVRQSQGAP